MRVFTLTTSLATALLPMSAVADWDSLKDVTTTASCGTGCGSLAPIFENDAFDDICDKLVEDGYVILDEGRDDISMPCNWLMN